MDDVNLDPKGLIRESYRIAGITDAECRSIFLDWALSLPAGIATADAIRGLLSARLDAQTQPRENHPMTAILEQGLVQMISPKRRGGWRSRDRN